MNFLKAFSNKVTPKEVAKDRLRLILIQDRGSLAPEMLEKIRVEILEVISKYIEIDGEEIDIAFNRAEDEDGNSGPALVANIPIKNLKTR